MGIRLVDAERDHSKNFRAVEDLGSHVQKTAALLRAAVETNDRDDVSWLVSCALDAIQDAERVYDEWALPEEDASNG